MARSTYRNIRAGVQSPAPQPRPGAAQTVQPRPLFVVQEHHARRLHYDFPHSTRFLRKCPFGLFSCGGGAGPPAWTI